MPAPGATDTLIGAARSPLKEELRGFFRKLSHVNQTQPKSSQIADALYPKRAGPLSKFVQFLAQALPLG